MNAYTMIVIFKKFSENQYPFGLVIIEIYAKLVFSFTSKNNNIKNLGIYLAFHLLFNYYQNIKFYFEN